MLKNIHKASKLIGEASISLILRRQWHEKGKLQSKLNFEYNCKTPQ